MQVSGEISFNSVQFSGYAGFDEAKFCGDAKFFMAKFDQFATFARAHFCKAANFGATRVERAFTLEGATFDGAPDFVQAHFEEAPRLDNIRVRARMIDPAPEHMSNSEMPSSHRTKAKPAIARSYAARAARGAWRRVLRADCDMVARFRALKRIAIQGHDADREVRAARFAND